MKRKLVVELMKLTAIFGTIRAKRGLEARHLWRIAISLGVLLLYVPAFGQVNDVPVRLGIRSEVLGEERSVLVRTPPGYERNNERYPILYMTDGDAQIYHSIATVSFLARNGRIPEMIIVGITNTDRARDLTPTKAVINAAQFPTSGGADNFLKFIETELIPNIESKYRVHPYRIFAGHSLGGLFAVHVMLTRPDLFNAYIAVSPSLQWADEAELKRAEEFLRGRKEFKKTLYVSLGNEGGDIGIDFKRFREMLAQYKLKGFEWDAEQMLDEDHGSVVLRSHYQGLRKVFDGWRIKTDPETGLLTGGMEAVAKHYKWLSEKYGYPIQPPEGLINLLGYQLMGEGKMDEAIAVFKTNVETYPASANVYDSLGEAYEKSGRMELARPNYERAYTLGKQQNDPNTAIFKINFERAGGTNAQAADAKN